MTESEHYIMRIEKELAEYKARLQVMWTWMKTHSDTVIGVDEVFEQDHPEAANWFNEDGTVK